MFKIRDLLSVLLVVCSFASNATGTFSITECSSKFNNQMDFSDAPASYGVACHDTNYWQELGDKWDTDNEQVDPNTMLQPVNAEIYTDDGVAWRVSSDNGLTWSDFSTDQEIAQGDKVEFMFEFNRNYEGNHVYDNLKAWFDFEIDGEFSNTDDVITDIKWFKEEDSDRLENGVADASNDVASDWHNTRNNNKLNSADTSLVYIQSVDIPLDQVIGETWLRARVVCSNSLEHYSENMTMDATGYQHQGEVEDYKITIVARNTTPPSEVPEPSALALFAAGLLFAARKRKQNA